MPVLEFRGLQLDRFQQEAIEHINAGASVVVSAATGTGKTLIADYVIDRAFKEGKKVFYTAPIKALSNQKFSEFKASYGEDSVGILTGDVVKNPHAPLLIMTTEIYRNMLLTRDEILSDLSAVVFDEIHYLGDQDRGTVWEEAIIFSPEHVRFLCLSATIPNARQFAKWIESIKKHSVHVVTEKKRAVPLEHLFFDVFSGISTLDEIRKRKRHDEYPSYRELFHRGKRRHRADAAQAQKDARREIQRLKKTHIDLIAQLRKEGKTPCIYFCFSRANTELKAGQLADRQDFLNEEQRKGVRDFIQERMKNVEESIVRLETTQALIRCLQRGIAFHHAGLLPVLKELVEGIFAHNWLSVLYATETFAVGINLPARSVCFDSLEKYDGTHFRHLNSKEYFQLAGRAGRRGMDTVGYAISVIDPEFADLDRIAHLTSGDKEPLQSQYKLSYNTILNLIANHTKPERDAILQSSFYTYQTAGTKSEKMFEMYEKKVEKLQRLGYLEGDKLTERGEFARRIYNHELVLTELFTTSLADNYTPFQIVLLAAALEYEEKRAVTFKKGPTPVSKELFTLFAPYKTILTFFRGSSMEQLEPLLAAWYAGRDFASLLDLTTMPEGDIVRFMRRIIDVSQQVMHASTESEVRAKIAEAIAIIDRGIVQVKL